MYFINFPLISLLYGVKIFYWMRTLMTLYTCPTLEFSCKRDYEILKFIKSHLTKKKRKEIHDRTMYITYLSY